MICPACFNQLTETTVGAVTVDVCQGGCGGIWFDAFELQRAGERLLNIQRDLALQVDFARKRDCPRCAGIKLKRHFFSAKRRVEVDHCPNCGGYWLDAGELEKIREEKQAAADTATKGDSYATTEVIRYLYRIQVEIRAQP
jgi:Zn-finger nucleic acid-binding protein